MQVAARRLIVVSAISLFGASAGVALGNFAAGGSRSSGAEDIAAYMSLVSEAPAEPAQDDRATLAVRPGPSSYHCEGCDASPYKTMIDGAVADIAPLPRYQTQDAPLPPVHRDASIRSYGSPDGGAGSGSGMVGETVRPVQAPPLPE